MEIYSCLHNYQHRHHANLWAWQWWLSRKAHYTRYDEFGIEIPTNYSVHCIDVSKYQQVIDWTSVKAMAVDDVRLSFAFIKATEGNINEDRFFKRNWKKAKDAERSAAPIIFSCH